MRLLGRTWALVADNPSRLGFAFAVFLDVGVAKPPATTLELEVARPRALDVDVNSTLIAAVGVAKQEVRHRPVSTTLGAACREAAL